MMNTRKWLLMCPAVLIFSGLWAAPSTALAGVHAADDVVPADPTTWTGSTDASVGHTLVGSMTVDEGSGIVSGNAYLGRYLGGQGTVLITDTGSTWTNSQALYVGRDGTAALTVSDGGLVATQALYASLVDLFGDGTITTKGGTLDADIVFDITRGAQPTVIFGSGGALNLLVDGTAPLGVGYRATGTIAIADAVTVASTIGYLGFASGSQGTATVTGDGSAWTNSAELYVGRQGTGTLNIELGGQVSNTIGYLGHTSGSVGTATVTGDGSQWTNSAELYVGRQGTGTLDIELGGHVWSKTGYVGHAAGSEGTVTVTGSGSQWTTTPHLIVGNYGTGTLTIADGGKVVSGNGGTVGNYAGSHGTVTVTGADSTWTNSSAFDVGYRGAGALTIADGGHVTSRWSHVGREAPGTATVTGSGSKWTITEYYSVGYYNNGTLLIENGGEVLGTRGGAILGWLAAGHGIVTVTGSGSKWTEPENIRVGHLGTGTLTVADGGLVTARTLYASLDDLHGDGTIAVSGAVLDDAHIVFDGTTGTTPTVAFGTGGSLHLDVDTSTYLGAGYKGAGEITITGGVSVGSHTALLGDRAGSHGTATVTGDGSKWTTTNYVFVGEYGTGTLTIEDGGQVSSTGGWHVIYISRYSGSQGTITVSGDGSKLFTSGGPLYVGEVGTGTLVIEAGGQVSNPIGYIAPGYKSHGTVTVTGDGSTWTNSAALYVGSTGTGTLNIEDGGKVSNTIGYMAQSGYGRASATISGAGSQWTNSQELYVGIGHNGGTATLTIEAGGQVSNTTGYLGQQSVSYGTATVTGAGSKWTNSGNLYVGYDGTGALTIADGGAVEVGHELNVGGSGTVNLAGGGLRATTVDHVSGGEFNFTGGTLEVETFRGDLDNRGGTLSPGLSLGQAVIEGSYTQSPAGRLLIEVSGAGHDTLTVTGAADVTDSRLAPQYDVLTVAGDVALSGLLELDWLPIVGDPGGKFGGAYDVIVYGGELTGVVDVAGQIEAYVEGIDYAYDLGDGWKALRITLHDLLDGDANLDGKVEYGDLMSLMSGFGGSGTGWSFGDFDLDYRIDAADYILLKTNMGVSLPVSGGVPEPATLLLLALGGLALLKKNKPQQRCLANISTNRRRR